MKDHLEDDYQDRAVVFIDILGFSAAVRRMSTDKVLFNQILNALSSIREGGEISRLFEDVKVSIFSDSVFISSGVSPDGIRTLILSIEMLTLDLLQIGFFIRGGATIGKLIHDEKLVVGEGVLQAYYLESEIANYPRVIISRRLQNQIRQYIDGGQLEKEFENKLKRSSDGPAFVNSIDEFFRLAKSVQNSNHVWMPREREIERQAKVIGPRLKARLEEAADNPSHFEKAWWFCDYWNGFVSQLFGKLPGIQSVDKPS